MEGRIEGGWKVLFGRWNGNKNVVMAMLVFLRRLSLDF